MAILLRAIIGVLAGIGSVVPGFKRVTDDNQVRVTDDDQERVVDEAP